MKYRLYKKSGSISYKDIEAESIEEAEKHKYDPRESGWICISDGLILDHIVSEDTKNEDHDIFIKRDIAYLKEDKS